MGRSYSKILSVMLGEVLDDLKEVPENFKECVKIVPNTPWCSSMIRVIYVNKFKDIVTNARLNGVNIGPLLKENDLVDSYYILSDDIKNYLLDEGIVIYTKKIETCLVGYSMLSRVGLDKFQDVRNGVHLTPAYFKSDIEQNLYMINGILSGRILESLKLRDTEEYELKRNSYSFDYPKTIEVPSFLNSNSRFFQKMESVKNNLSRAGL